MSVGSPELLVGADASAEAGLDFEGQDVAARSPLELFWRRLRSDRVAVAGGVFIVWLILVAIFAPVIVNLVGAPGPNVPDHSAVNEFGLPSGPSPHALTPFIAFGLGAVLAMLSRMLPWRPVKRYAWAVLLGVGTIAAIVLAATYWPDAKHIFGVDLNT